MRQTIGLKQPIVNSTNTTHGMKILSTLYENGSLRIDKVKT